MEKNLKLNAIWNTLGITVNSFNSLFFLIIINRVNGVEIAGIFSFAFSIACLLFIVGIYAGRTYQVSDINENLNNYEYLVHKCITCTMMFLIAIVFIVVQKYSLEKNVIIILLCLYKLFEAMSETFYGFLQKNDELYIVGKSLFFKSLVCIIIFFVIDFLTKDIIVSCVALNINSFLFVFLYDIKKSKKYLNKFQKIRWNKIFGLFKKGFSVFAFSFLAVYIVNVPKYVIDILLDNRFQTIFSIIVMPGTVMSLCGQYIMAPLLTNVVECYNQKKYKEFKNIIFKILGILVVLGIIVELGAATIGIPILGIVYAIDLNAYVLDLIIIIFGAILYAIAGVFSTALITMRRNGMQLIIYLIDAIFSVIISYLFISTFGIHGATIGYTSTMVLHVILYTIYFLYEYSKLVKSED